MIRRILTFTVLAVALGAPFHENATASGILTQVTAHLRERILTGSIPSKVFCRNEFLCGSSLLPRFYSERSFRPAWIDEAGLSYQAEVLIQMIHTAHLEGLAPEDYHLATIESLTTQLHRKRSWRDDPNLLVDLDMLLTDAFLIYASHLLTGRVDPETIHTKWIAYTRKANLIQLLHTALITKSVESTLKSLRPSHPGYETLRNALKHYRDIASRGGWHTILSGTKMERGSVGTRVRTLRRHLTLTGDLVPGDEAAHNVFDETLERAVKRYQKRHGLVVDGIVGNETLARLNVSAGELVRTLSLNLERWRWIPRDLGVSYIMVNIADFHLDVIHRDESVMKMRVVVGSNYRRTPVFSGTMTYLVLNPFWYIPEDLVANDIYPAVKENSQYLTERSIRVFKSWGENAPQIDPASIDWSHPESGSVAYKFRQDPGPLNPLGQIKFIFPNKFAVYLHDTPQKELFNLNSRGFSAGCIRAEKPIELALYLLKDNPQWTRETIEDVLESGERLVVHLPWAVPVHILYWTAWVDRDGRVNFRDDIYDRDDPLYEALLEKPPAQ